MRLKTPLFLALIVGSLVAIIFLIWPEFQKIEPLKDDLKKKEELVASLRQKNENIANLTRSLNDSRNFAGKEFALGYIPLEKKEELIFNSISGIANAEGIKVALSNVSLQLAKGGASTATEQLPPSSSYLATGSTDPMATETVQPVSVLPAVEIIKADISIAGNYESQKNFLAKLYTLDMLKNITNFNLSSAGGEGASGDILNGNFSAEFSFIPEAKIGTDYNNPIFSVASFNFETVEKLRAMLSQKTIGVAVEGAGRSNPFLP